MSSSTVMADQLLVGNFDAAGGSDVIRVDGSSWKLRINLAKGTF